jgi:co-chaperonin GroES (HSP10)
MTVRPLRDLLLVREVESRGVTQHGAVYLVSREKSELVHGEVIAKGPKAGPDVNPGDIIRWNRRYGREAGNGMLFVDYKYADLASTPEPTH